MIKKKLFFSCIILLFISCDQSKYRSPSHPIFTQLTPKQTGIHFANKVTSTSAFNIFNYHSFYDGGGVAIGDVNNDGLADIFLVSNQQENKLYLNKGNWHFEDITQQAGLSVHKNWSTGVAMADVNGDGLLDIYICNSGLLKGDARANQLFINQGANKKRIPTFKEEAKQYGLADTGMSTQAAFFDYDGDGDLDCFMLNNTLNPLGYFKYNSHHLRNRKDTVNGQKLYRNDQQPGRQTIFTDVTSQAGIYSSVIGFGLGINVSDLNGDHWPDMYVSNDFFEKDYLYINQQNGTFKESSDEQLGHESLTSMGADIADINNDGRPDIFTTDMLPESDYRLKTISSYDHYDATNAKLQNDFHHQFMRNMLQLNNGSPLRGDKGGTFSEIGQYAGVSATDWTWGPLLFDFNNDGWKDIFVTNGIYKDITDQDFLYFLGDQKTMQEVAQKGVFNFKDFEKKIPSHPLANYGFINQRDLQFKNEAYTLGLGKPGFSSGAAYGDLDNDGDLDLVVNNENMPCFIYRNNENEMLHHHYLRIKLKGAHHNTFGIGAEITAYGNGQQIYQEEMPQRGFESSVDLVLVFGLGKIAKLDSLVIIWPGKAHKMQKLENIKTDQTITLYQKNANHQFIPESIEYHPLYKNISTDAFIGNTKHMEDFFIDFDREKLMPHMLSTEGPKCAKGDINGDGLEDIFIGGAKDDPGKIFIQTPNGKFRRLQEKALDDDMDYEDIGAAFFDADGDGDLDLMVASGGNEYSEGSSMLMPRLYINDGEGIFKRSPNAVPENISTNASCLRPYDFDGDGDMDVFIGGRDIPGRYGATPRSYLLQNDGKGYFKDVTDKFAPGLKEIGMVTGAAWTDVNKDNKKDLVIVGEWMPVTIFKNSGSRLQKTKEMANSSGWWNCIKAADIDDDGDMDFVLGNLGLNSRFKANATHPVRLYVNDFDKNGQVECILTYYKSDSISYPLAMRNEMILQIPSLKSKFPKYADYAGKTIDQIFSPEEIKEALKRNVKYLQSALLINDGKNKFRLQALPARAQFSPVYGILVKDLDGDGKQDILLGGNFYGVKPETGRYDASYGCFLKGDGHGHFTYISPKQSGIFIKGEVRDMINIKGKSNNEYILITRNNDKALLFKKNY